MTCALVFRDTKAHHAQIFRAHPNALRASDRILVRIVMQDMPAQIASFVLQAIFYKALLVLHVVVGSSRYKTLKAAPTAVLGHIMLI